MIHPCDIPLLYANNVKVVINVDTNDNSQEILVSAGGNTIKIPPQNVSDFSFSTSIGVKLSNIPYPQYTYNFPIPQLDLDTNFSITFYYDYTTMKLSITELTKLREKSVTIPSLSITYIYTNNSSTKYKLQYNFSNIYITDIQFSSNTLSPSTSELLGINMSGVYHGLIIKFIYNSNVTTYTLL